MATMDDLSAYFDSLPEGSIVTIEKANGKPQITVSKPAPAPVPFEGADIKTAIDNVVLNKPVQAVPIGPAQDDQPVKP